MSIWVHLWMLGTFFQLFSMTIITLFNPIYSNIKVMSQSNKFPMSLRPSKKQLAFWVMNPQLFLWKKCKLPDQMLLFLWSSVHKFKWLANPPNGPKIFFHKKRCGEPHGPLGGRNISFPHPSEVLEGQSNSHWSSNWSTEDLFCFHLFFIDSQSFLSEIKELESHTTKFR